MQALFVGCCSAVWRYFLHEVLCFYYTRDTMLASNKCIAVRKVANLPHRYGNSHAIWDHTVLPATRQRWHSRPYPSQSGYSIKRPWRDARLSWPSWLVTYRDGIPARRQSPISVVTATVLAVSVCLSVCVCVCHKSVFYHKGWTDWSDLWDGGFFRPGFFPLCFKEIQICT